MIGLLSVSVGIPTGGQKENALASSGHTCADMQAKCSGYNNIMMFCCKQAEGREANDAMCARFAENAVICGGSEHMEATMQSCCASEWTDGATLQDIRVRKQRLGVHGVIGEQTESASSAQTQASGTAASTLATLPASGSIMYVCSTRHTSP